MKQTNTRRASQIITVSAAALLLGACATAPQRIPALEQAKADYERAAADPQVVRSAPIELRKAQQALQQAQAAQSGGEDLASIQHYSRLAKQRTEVAVQTGKLASAEQAVANAGMQRDRIVIESRTQEADSQRAMAEKARDQADAARKLAEERLAAIKSSQAQAATELARAKSLEEQLADLKAKQTNRGMVLTLGDVLFDTGRAELKPGAERSLDQLVAFMSQNPTRTVVIEGYTDSMGSEQSNQLLSEQRANAVKNALMMRGVEFSRVSARGYGEASPVASNGNAAGRQQNRRVEIVISGT